ncbi:hypothetical protein TWF694_008081 [Orbilia ellipsospora]|uniref:Integral membrane protein n=1 Tax=Orbilia ellipsospora TaxID=2528407 RepID=A0AAV9XFK5_9PEZI
METLLSRAVNQTDVGWPFGTNGLKPGGSYMKNHTSTVSFVYQENTIPTPWPWLLVSFAISFAVASWGYYSTLKQRHEAKGENTRARITLVVLVLTTIRSIATFILAIKAYMSPLRYPANSAIAALFISALSSALDCGLLPARYYGFVFKRLAQLNAWITFAALVMMFALPFVRREFEYGRFTIAGGHCPVAVTNCPYHPLLIGCPNDYDTLSEKERASFWGATVSPLQGLNLANSIISPMEVAIVVLAAVVGGYIAVSGFRLIGRTQEMVEYIWNWREESERKKNREQEANSEELYFVGSLKREKPKAPIRRDASAFIILAILLFTAVSVPIHAYEEAHPKSIIIVDGIGPPDKPKLSTDGPTFRSEFLNFSGENANATSWSDCYPLTAPASKDGFISAWIELQKKDPLTFLAML